MAFPFDSVEEVEEVLQPPKEYGVNFETGQLTGEIVDGVDAVKVWVWNTLKTKRYLYDIFTWDYGHELEDLIGQSYSREYLEVETKRMVEDCLSVNEYISGIDNFTVNTENDKLEIKFTIQTILGEEVDIVV